MLRMIIADDEKIIRETIRNIIDWDSMGIEVIGICKNGIEAYDMILDEYPDIVLTDIKMPGLSGLELIKRISQVGQQIEFVILSGYGDYTFTKEAMKYGIQHYLLKPCSETEIIEVMQEVKKQCCRKRAKIDQQKQDFLLLKKLHESVIYNLVVEGLSDVPDFTRLSEQYERFLSFTSVRYEVCCMKNLSVHQLEACLSQLRRYHRERAPGIPLYAICGDADLYVGFESYDYDYTALDSQLAALPGVRAGDGRVSFQNLNTLMPVLSQHLHRYQQLVFIAEDQQIRLWNRKPLYQIAENFVRQVSQADGARYEEAVAVLAEKLEEIPDIDTIRAIATNIFLNLSVRYADRKASLGLIGFIMEIGACSDLEKVRAAVIERLLSTRSQEEHTHGGTEFMERVIAYVRGNIGDPELSLKNIAENVLYMNVDYLSKKFLKCMGCKFSVFLANTRIEKAMQLLADTQNHTVTSVAAAVGCGNNPQYFSQLFKKNTGMTPTEYIKSMGG